MVAVSAFSLKGEFALKNDAKLSFSRMQV